MASEGSPNPAEQTGVGSRRTLLARRRAHRAKFALCALAAGAFAASVVLARVSFAGHPKSPVQSLSAPPRFVTIVRENLLEAGLLAPADAPPDAATALS